MCIESVPYNGPHLSTNRCGPVDSMNSNHSTLFHFGRVQMGTTHAILEGVLHSYLWHANGTNCCVSAYQQRLSPCSASGLDETCVNLRYHCKELIQPLDTGQYTA